MYGTNKTLGGAGNTILYTVNITGTITLAGNVTSTDIITISGTLDAAAYNLVLTYSNGITPLNITTGNFVASSSTVVYGGGSSEELTVIASSTYYNLIINDPQTVLSGNVTTTNILTINSGKILSTIGYNINLTRATGTPLVINGTFLDGSDPGRSTVTYSGATSANIATATYTNLVINTAATLSGNVTTTDILTVNSSKSLDAATYTINLTRATGTPFVVNGAFTPSTSTVSYDGANSANISGGPTYYNLIVNTAGTLAGSSLAVTNILTINVGKSFDQGIFDISLSKNSGTPFVNNGVFTASTSAFSYTGTGPVTTTAASYYTLTLGSGTYNLGGNTTSTNSFTNGGTFTIGSSYYLYAPGTFDNNGTITESGVIKHPITSAKLTNSSGTEVSSYTATGDSAYVSVTDSDGNLNASALDTITGSVVTENTNSDSETITLTETGADTGIFRSAALPFTVSNSASANSGVFNVNGNGTLSLAFIDSKESSDTGSDTASFSASAYNAGGGRAYSATNLFTSATVSLNSATAGSIVGRDIILKFNAANAEFVAISENKDFSGGSWMPYAIEKNFTLSAGDGLKQIYVKFRAKGGEESGIFTVPITLGTQQSASVVATIANDVSAGVSYKFTKYLYLRFTGAEVRALQQKLKDLGYFTYPKITGYFGPATRAAVVKFQKDNNLKPYPGWVGPGTRAALNNL